MYPDEAEWEQSVARIKYTELQHVTVPGKTQEYMNTYVEHTFGKDFPGKEKALIVARLCTAALSGCGSIYQVTVAYNKALEQVKEKMTLKPKEWETMLKIAGFDESRDKKMLNMIGDGMRI